MNWNELHFIAALGFLVLLTLGPVFAWPQTRKLTPLVLFSYILFLAIQWDFVAGPVMAFHDTAWNLEGWYTLIQQWVYAGEPLGWNPYLGAGQPFSIYNNVLITIPAVAFSWLFKVLGLPFSPTQNFKLIWIFAHLNICSGSLLFFRILFKENWICMMGFISLLFGGLFFVELGENIGVCVLSFLPYLLFFLIRFYQERTWAPFVLFFLFSGVAANYYIPTYLVYTLFFFVLSAIIVNHFKKNVSLVDETRALCKVIWSKPLAMVLALVLLLMTAAPMFLNYLEIKDYASPTRGFSVDGAKTTGSTHQPGVAVPLYRYRTLAHLDMKDTLDTHSGFYLGLIPCIAVVASLITGGHWLFITLCLILVVIALPDIFGFPFWQWFRQYTPLGETLRHTFMFGRLATFFLIPAAMMGLLTLRNGNAPMLRKVLAVALGATVWAALNWSGWPPSHQVNMVLAALALILLASSRMFPHKFWPTTCLILVLGFHALDMVGNAFRFSIPQDRFWGRFEYPRQYSLNKIQYPQRWQVKPENSIPAPQYLKSIYNKEAIWANKFPDSMMWLQKDLSQFLLHQKFLDPGFHYFNPNSYRNVQLKQAEGSIFYVLRAQEGKEVEDISLQALKQVAKMDRPVLKLEHVFNETDGSQSAANNESGTQSQPDSSSQNAPLWVSFSIQSGFQPDRLEMHTRPWAMPWKGDHVELWESEDQRSWTFLQKLDIQDATPHQGNHTWTFPLKKPISNSYFKLVIDRKHFNFFSGVQLVESESGIKQGGVKGLKNPILMPGSGLLVQRPSASSNRVTLDINFPQAGYILRMENYHKNWTATLDGEDVPITRVQPNFQTVRVPAGKHVLTFQFESVYPKLVLLHIVTGVLGGVVLLGWLAGVRLDRFRQWVPPLRQTTHTER
ncbi:conserved membrane protein of unknown function [Nitrospina watsonii]|uniref:F5/8 type C domain-containing protein n=1 Tax=Nitrospina watsonii TaxID=1323948 RepID=A0ABM9HA28_9BACT|nr:conserved membrane protein of unknown function [Nitrospina watsonii]